MRIQQAVEALRGKSGLRAVGAIAGLACLVAAVVLAWREGGGFVDALLTLRDAPAWETGALLLSVALGVALTALLFQVLMRRFARVTSVEMLALIAASSLANYLPLKPGLVGRAAYHRVRHGVPVQATFRTLVEAIALSGAVAALFLCSVATVRLLGAAGGWAAIVLLAPAMVAAWPGRRALAWALLVRQAEFALAALRYWLVFRMIGSSLEPEAAIVLAAINAVATMVPFVAGGLGVREWLVGLATPLVSPETFAQGVAAELVHRAAELAVIGPCGALSIAFLARRGRTPPPGAGGQGEVRVDTAQERC